MIDLMDSWKKSISFTNLSKNKSKFQETIKNLLIHVQTGNMNFSKKCIVVLIIKFLDIMIISMMRTFV